MEHSRLFTFILAAGVVAMGGGLALRPQARAQTEAPPPYAGLEVSATGHLTVSGPNERSPEAITADANIAPSGAVPNAARQLRPTMSMARYAALKAAANAEKVSSGRPSPAAGATPPIPIRAFGSAKEGVIGIDEFPSDVDMDVSYHQVAQVTNASLWVFDKMGTTLAWHSLNALFGTGDWLGDPQILFDSTWHRWIISTDDFTTPPKSFSYLWLAVSKNSSAAGSWYIYRIVLSGGEFTAANFLDYPHLGIDQDALLFTGNIFANGTEDYVDTVAFAIAKAPVYEGRNPGSPKIFTGLAGTLMPPVQLGAPWYDQNGVDYFAAAVPESGVYLYAMSEAGRSTVSLSGPVAVPATDFSVPPDAMQPGCTQTIDTLDGRFQNACYQIPASDQFPDGLLYCVHTIDGGGRPIAQWYAFDPSASDVAFSGTFSFSATSNDFNPSIAADGVGDIVVTETATDPARSIKPMILFGGALRGNPVALNATPAGGSHVCLTGNTVANTNLERWGDYSAARFDPATSATGVPGKIEGWITNQKVLRAAQWGTRIARIEE